MVTAGIGDCGAQVSKSYTTTPRPQLAFPLSFFFFFFFLFGCNGSVNVFGTAGGLTTFEELISLHPGTGMSYFWYVDTSTSSIWPEGLT